MLSFFSEVVSCFKWRQFLCERCPGSLFGRRAQICVLCMWRLPKKTSAIFCMQPDEHVSRTFHFHVFYSFWSITEQCPEDMDLILNFHTLIIDALAPDNIKYFLTSGTSCWDAGLLVLCWDQLKLKNRWWDLWASRTKQLNINILVLNEYTRLNYHRKVRKKHVPKVTYLFNFQTFSKNSVLWIRTKLLNQK